MSVNKTKQVRLGDYIQEYYVLNYDNSIKDVRSVSTTKEFKFTGAKVDKSELSKYKVVPPRYISYVQTTKNEKCFACAINLSNKNFVVTSVNKVITSLDENILNNEYLFLVLSRNDFDRYAIFNSWGSAREVFQYNDLCNVNIFLPPIEVQLEIVDLYKSIKFLAEQNEALIEPLSKACEAFIANCKKSYKKVELGEYIKELDIRNTDNSIKLVKSVSVTKEFKDTNAKVNKEELSGYKIVPPNFIAYVQTTKNEKCFANALNTTNDTYVVSQVDRVITTKDASKLDIGYLHLIFRSNEFDRYAIFNSWGSARETFDWSELCGVKIPLPPLEVQQSIVDLYKCLEEAKKIAFEAREKLKTLCPALVQRAANS